MDSPRKHQTFMVCFHSFRKIISCNQHKPISFITLWKWPQHVNGLSLHWSTNVVLIQKCSYLPSWSSSGCTEVTLSAVVLNILTALHPVKSLPYTTQRLVIPRWPAVGALWSWCMTYGCRSRSSTSCLTILSPAGVSHHLNSTPSISCRLSQ